LGFFIEDANGAQVAQNYAPQELISKHLAIAQLLLFAQRAIYPIGSQPLHLEASRTQETVFSLCNFPCSFDAQVWQGLTCAHSEARSRSDLPTTTSQQVNQDNDQCHHQQKVNQPTGDVEENKAQ
jgi:hypothetical protein